MQDVKIDCVQISVNKGKTKKGTSFLFACGTNIVNLCMLYICRNMGIDPSIVKEVLKSNQFEIGSHNPMIGKSEKFRIFSALEFKQMHYISVKYCLINFLDNSFDKMWPKQCIISFAKSHFVALI